MRHLVKVKKFQQRAYVHIPGFDWQADRRQKPFGRQGRPRHRDLRRHLGNPTADLALTQLGEQAGHKTFGSATVVNAFQQLALQRPDDVRKAVDQWLTDAESRPTDETLRRQTLGSFLALVSSDEGTDLILNSTHDTEARLRIIHAWRKMLSTDEAVDAVVTQLSRWHERFQRTPTAGKPWWTSSPTCSPPPASAPVSTGSW
ncbi:hypothetical protein SHIRM173S_13016 [Streptomyces hirsutus]